VNVDAEPQVASLLLARQAGKLGDQPFLQFRESEFTVADLYLMAGRMAAGLRDAGVRRGDMVGVMLPNCPEYVALSFGISFLGAIEVPVNVHHKGEILACLIGSVPASVLVLDASLADRFAELEAVPASLSRIVIRRAAGDSTTAPNLGAIPVEPMSAWSALEPLSPDPSVRPMDACCLLFTSGTTGPSKRSLLPHHYGFHVVDVLTAHLEIEHSDRIYTFMPLFHNNARFGAVLPALVHGCRLILADHFSVTSFWQDMRRHDVTLTSLVGGLVTGLLQKEPAAGDRDHRLRRVFTAGAGGKAVVDFEARFGVRVIEGYGMTEVNVVLLNSLSRNVPGSIGRADCGFDVRIHDQHDAEVPVGSSGEIVVRPKQPYTMQLRYYGMPERTVASSRNLWFHTGDLGYRNEAGDFFFVDRQKDSIRRLGENISSMELEAIVNRHPAVLETAAVAIPAEDAEDEVKLVVVLKAGAEIGYAEMLDYCRRQMARFMVPRYLEFRHELPRNQTGRIEKYRLKQEGLHREIWDGTTGRFVDLAR